MKYETRAINNVDMPRGACDPRIESSLTDLDEAGFTRIDALVDTRYPARQYVLPRHEAISTYKRMK